MKRSIPSLIVATALFSAAENGLATTAIAVETVSVVFDGKSKGELRAGTTVEVIGEKKAEGQSLVRFTPEGSDEVMGMVPTTALVESKSTNHGSAVATGGSELAQVPAPGNLDQQMTAVELAEYLENNRAKFPDLAGKIVKVGGVVESLRVDGKVGSMVTAEITLKTRPNLPKIRLMVHASEFMDNSKGDRFEMRVQGQTLEGRSRDTRYPYKYWHWYDGYWRSRSVAKSEWVPIISVGEPLQGRGVLGKYHINVDLEGATIDKG